MFNTYHVVFTTLAQTPWDVLYSYNIVVSRLTLVEAMMMIVVASEVTTSEVVESIQDPFGVVEEN